MKSYLERKAERRMDPLKWTDSLMGTDFLRWTDPLIGMDSLRWTDPLMGMNSLRWMDLIETGGKATWHPRDLSSLQGT